MYKIIVIVFLCLCCFITTIPVNRRHRIRPTNTSHALAGNQSGFLLDYDLGLGGQGKDSISAGRVRLFQYPPMNNGPVSKKEDATEIGPKPEDPTLPIITKNYGQPRELFDGEKHKLRARDGDGGNVVEAKAQETTVREIVSGEPEDDEEGSPTDEDENRGNILGSDLKEDISKDKKQQLKVKPPEPETEDEEDRDDEDDDNDGEAIPKKIDEESEEGGKDDEAKVLPEKFGFKSLLTSKSRVGHHVLGNGVDGSYEVTYARNWKDTRVEEWRSALARAGIMSNPLEEYYPSNTKNLSTVCILKSSIINFPKVFKWLHKMILNITYTQRPIYIELRRELFTFGQSELCHKTNMTNWKEYQYCALIRNQRMEYMIPHYPLHQIGYRYLFKAQTT